MMFNEVLKYWKSIFKLIVALFWMDTDHLLYSKPVWFRKFHWLKLTAIKVGKLSVPIIRSLQSGELILTSNRFCRCIFSRVILDSPIRYLFSHQNETCRFIWTPFTVI
jgi:hypothetical protein